MTGMRLTPPQNALPATGDRKVLEEIYDQLNGYLGWRDAQDVEPPVPSPKPEANGPATMEWEEATPPIDATKEPDDWSDGRVLRETKAQARRAESGRPEPADEDASRARELRDAAQSGRLPPDTDYSKFQVQNKPPAGGKRVCKALPFQPGMKNKFQDDGKLASDFISDSKALSEKKQPEPRRPPSGQVTVKCCKCEKEETVPPLFAPRSLDRGDQSSYVCNDCMKKATKRGRE